MYSITLYTRLGVLIVKTYKSKNGKLVLYLPFDVINNLKLKEGDEVDFLKTDSGNYVFVKKADIANLLLSRQEQQPEVKKRQVQGYQAQSSPRMRIPSAPSPEELAVLKKIDTIRYDARTTESTAKILNDAEKRVLQKLILDGSIVPFKGKDGKERYSISKSIYDNFLMRKKPVKEQPSPESVTVPTTTPIIKSLQDENVALLERNGFIVLPTEAEAGKVSLLLEQSIRRGQVLGTRAFNKKFYIVLRSYFDRVSPGILKKLREKNYRITDLSRELSADEEGLRAILYLLSENGDVSEKKRDLFALA